NRVSVNEQPSTVKSFAGHHTRLIGRGCANTDFTVARRQATEPHVLASRLLPNKRKSRALIPWHNRPDKGRWQTQPRSNRERLNIPRIPCRLWLALRDRYRR